MSEQRHPVPTIDPEMVATALASALVAGKSARGIAKACARWRAEAERLEALGSRFAGVYPINGDRKPIGERPADFARLEAARVLREQATRIATLYRLPAAAVRP